MSPIVVSIDGNIGSGKSSILKYLQNNFENYCKSKNKNLKICFLQEPVSEWETIIDKNDGKNAIEKFYENNEKYAFAFQMMAYISRLSIFRKAFSQDYDIIFTERSIYTDRNIFASMLYKAGKMNDIEYQIYNKWFDEYAGLLQDIKTVYIRTNPNICDLRVKKRKREGENISLEYLQDCNYYHEIWLYKESNNILIVNGNEETNTSVFFQNTYYDDIINKIYQFII